MAGRLHEDNTPALDIDDDKGRFSLLEDICKTVHQKFMEHPYAEFSPSEDQRENAANAVADHYADTLIARHNNLAEEEDEWQLSEDEMDTIGDFFYTLADTIDNRPRPHAKRALVKKKVSHLAATRIDAVTNMLHTSIDQLGQELNVDDSGMKHLQEAYAGDKGHIPRLLRSRRRIHDFNVIQGLAFIGINDVKSTGLDDEIEAYRNHTGFELESDFVAPMREAREKLGGAVENLWELLVWTDAITNGNQIIHDFDASQYFFNKEGYKAQFTSTLKGLYARQISNLNKEFEAHDDADTIAEKTGLTLDAAQFIKHKYDYLKNTDNIDLCHDSNGAAVYRPTGARVLLSNTHWMDDFFRDHGKSDRLSRDQKTELRNAYEFTIREAAQDQLKQYLVNLPDLRDRVLTDTNDARDLKAFLDDCAENAPGDNGSTSMIWNAILQYEAIDRRFKQYAKRRRI